MYIHNALNVHSQVVNIKIEQSQNAFSVEKVSNNVGKTPRNVEKQGGNVENISRKKNRSPQRSSYTLLYIAKNPFHSRVALVIFNFAPFKALTFLIFFPLWKE